MYIKAKKSKWIKLCLTTLLVFQCFSSVKIVFAQEPYINTSKLVARYSFDGNLEEVVGGNNGVAHGGIQYTKGLFGQALLFDGIDDYIEVPKGLNFTGDFSVSLVLKPEKGMAGLIHKGEMAPDGNPNYVGNGYNITLDYKKAGILTDVDASSDLFVNAYAVEPNGNFSDERVTNSSIHPIDTNRYQSLVVVFRSNAWEFYVDGNLVSTQNIYQKGGSGDLETIPPENFTGIHQTNATMKFGAIETWYGFKQNFVNYYKGILDEVDFFNAALSTTDIQIISSNVLSAQMTPTLTPTSTATPKSTETPTATATPKSTATSTATPTATATTKPTSIPTSMLTSKPTSTALASVTPIKSLTPTPTELKGAFNNHDAGTASSYSNAVISTPTQTQTPTPTSTLTLAASTAVPKQTQELTETIPQAPSDYIGKIENFKREITKMSDESANMEDAEKSAVIVKKAQRVIEDITLEKVSLIDRKVEISKTLISPQVETALRAKKEMENFLKDYVEEKEISLRVKIQVESSENDINLYVEKEVADVMEKQVDVSIATHLGNVVLYHKNIKRQLATDLIISLSKRKEQGVHLKFKTYSGKFMDRLSEYIGLELPYGNVESEYGTVYRESNGSILNIGGHEDMEMKLMKVKTKSSGRYYTINGKTTFKDIEKESAEVREAVEKLAAKGVLRGRSKDSFDPSAKINRQEFVFIIISACSYQDEEAVVRFKDVKKTAWYYPSVAIGCKRGLIAGYEDNTFRGMRIINKQEITKICAAALNEEKKYKFPKNQGKYLEFQDKEKIPEWVRKFVALGNREGIIIKRKDNRFLGTNPCTRGEAAIMLYRLYKKLD